MSGYRATAPAPSYSPCSATPGVAEQAEGAEAQQHDCRGLRDGGDLRASQRWRIFTFDCAQAKTCSSLTCLPSSEVAMSLVISGKIVPLDREDPDAAFKGRVFLDDSGAVERMVEATVPHRPDLRRPGWLMSATLRASRPDRSAQSH